MDKKQIDKMVRVDFCDNQDYKIKLYNKYGIKPKVSDANKKPEKKEEVKKDKYPDY
jgi:hypothetical protein